MLHHGRVLGEDNWPVKLDTEALVMYIFPDGACTVAVASHKMIYSKNLMRFLSQYCGSFSKWIHPQAESLFPDHSEEWKRMRGCYTS